MPLARFQIPPGVNKKSTQYAAGQSWYDANNVRWKTDHAETIGGWKQDPDNTSTFYGIVRAIFSWKDFSDDSFRFIGTNSKFYVSSGDNKVDITPVRATQSSLTDPFKSVRSGTHIVTIEDVDHGAKVGDFVVFTAIADATIGGISSTILVDITEGFEIVHIIDENNYMIALFDGDYNKIQFTVNEVSVGGTCDVEYKVNTGINGSVVTGRGWGAGAWGEEEPLGLAGVGLQVTDIEVTATSFPYVRLTIDGSSLSPFPSPGDLIYISDCQTATVSSGTATTTSISSPPLYFNEIGNNWYSVVFANSGANQITIRNPQNKNFTALGAVTDPKQTGGTLDTNFAIADRSVGGDGYLYETRNNLSRNWGDASNENLSVAESRKVYVDNFGEDLLISNGFGPIYYYDTSSKTSAGVPITGEVAVDITSVTGQLEAVKTCTTFLMSEKFGHCVALGANDVGATPANSMLVRWSDAFNPFDWFPTPSNEAGGQTLDQGSSIVTGIATKNENLIFTNSAVYSMKYVGFPITYGFDLVTSRASIVSENAVTAVDDQVFFMAEDAFYMYNGRLNVLSDNVLNYVFDDINTSEISKSFCDTNYKFSEILFFYPSSSSIECDRFVSYNYANGTWSIGTYDMSPLGNSGTGSDTSAGTTFNRTSWNDAIVYQFPVAGVLDRFDTDVTESTAGATGQGQPSTVNVPAVRSMLFSHENGTSAQETAINAHVETGDLDLMDGQKYAFYRRVIPDVDIFDSTGTSDKTITVGIKGKDLPGKSQKPEKSVTVRYTGGETETYEPDFNSTAIRGRARSASIRVSAASSTFGWRLGDIRIDVQPDGEKS